MKVTQVIKGRRIFYLCNKHLKNAKTYNPDIRIISYGDSLCDKCEEEFRQLEADRINIELDIGSCQG